MQKLFFKLLPGGDAEITASYPSGMIKTTPENLKAAADGESHEWGPSIPDLQKLQKRKALRKLQRHSVTSRKWKYLMSNGSANSLQRLSREPCLSGTLPPGGNAETVGMSMKDQKHQIPARFVHMHRHTLNSGAITINTHFSYPFK